MLKMPLNP